MKFAVIFAALALFAAPALAQTTIGPILHTSAAGTPDTTHVVTIQGCPSCSHVIVDQGSGWNFQGSVAAGATSGFGNPFAIAGFTTVTGGVGSGSLNELAISATGAASMNCIAGCYQATQPISATALPLPTGAATAANQSGNSGWLETSTAISANAFFSGASRSLPTWASYFTCSSYALGSSGILTLEIVLGSGVALQYSQTTSSNATYVISERVVGPSTGTYSCNYQNGSTALTNLTVGSGFTHN